MIVDDIINLPNHRSTKHPPMSNYMRAAQFAPFAALTGYDGMVSETARLTTGKSCVDDDEKFLLNLKLQYIFEKIKDSPFISVVYFKKDSLKKGGAYKTKCGRLKKIDTINRKLIFDDKVQIFIDDILDLSIEESDFEFSDL